MERELMERRRLELMIRRAEAEERLLERRLERIEADQWRARRAIRARLGEQPWNRLVG
jgi:DnaJ-domain-containing protein 1